MAPETPFRYSMREREIEREREKKKERKKERKKETKRERERGGRERGREGGRERERGSKREREVTNHIKKDTLLVAAHCMRRIPRRHGRAHHNFFILRERREGESECVCVRERFIRAAHTTISSS